MRNNNTILSRTECNVMRGIAIIAIMTNNFGHMINGVYPDNEFTYDYTNVSNFLNSLHHLNNLFPLNLLSFYSPFGVMVFIFLSGYGLTLKYEKQNTPISCTSFISNHYVKLFIMQAKGLALFYLIYLLFHKNEFIFILPFIKQLFLIGNITNSPICPGPYWFFGMIFEIYVIYRILLYKRSSLLIIIISILSLFIMGISDPNGDTMSYLRINFAMAILPFCMGILTARHLNQNLSLFQKSMPSCWLFLFVSIILLTICKLFFYFWLFMPIFIISTVFYIVKIVSRVRLFSNFLTWIGGLSGVIFVVHPTIRDVIISRTNDNNHPYEIVIYIFLTIVLSIILEPIFSNNKASQTQTNNDSSNISNETAVMKKVK